MAIYSDATAASAPRNYLYLSKSRADDNRV